MPGDPGSADSEPLNPFASEARVCQLLEQHPVVVYIDKLYPSTL
jgi:hypothetical protein